MEQKKTIVFVSGYWGPLHSGHLALFKEAKKLGDELLVIVNNDKQQVLKKGKVIMSSNERMDIINELRCVDGSYLSVDEDSTVCKTIESLGKTFQEFDLVFANGGDDRSNIMEIPEREVCQANNIRMVFGVGGMSKLNSSSNINKLRGKE